MRRTLGVVVGVLLSAGVVGGVVLAVDQDQAAVTVAASGAEAPLEELETPMPTTTTSLPASTTTTMPATTTSTAPTTTTTQLVATTTTTIKPSPTVTITDLGPATGDPRYHHVLLRGAGCSGAENGWGFTVYNPAGEPFNGDGGQATADGNWEMQFSFYFAHAPGRYAFKASCSVANGPVLFSYQPAYYEWAGSSQ